MSEYLTLEEASKRVGKSVDNIRDYIQRGRISKYNQKGEKIEIAKNGELRVSILELITFLSLVSRGDEKHYYPGLNAELGFYDLSETERTKHVHRLHPYLGKFIPQLVEWFLNKYFEEDSIILDPFMGSGTTLVQGNELRLHTIGVDVSEFNCLIARAKTQKYDLKLIRQEVLDIEKRTTLFSRYLNKSEDVPLSLFPDDRMEELQESLLEECNSEYLRTWFAPNALLEILYYKSLIPLYQNQDLLKVLLSRSVRSSRLIPHYDLATPKAPLPVGQQYWCRKHDRYCIPINNCITKIHQYSLDTIQRIEKFDCLRSEKEMIVIRGDSRKIDLPSELEGSSISGRMIDGIFTSPPYVGQIDYHDQHIYAYELFGFAREDDLEIGPKKKGKSKNAQVNYSQGIIDVLRNSLKYLKPDGKVFIVANDKFSLYPQIAKESGLVIQDHFRRAVTKRTEQGDSPYEETIFLMRKE